MQEEHFGFSPRKATFPPEALRAVLASVRPQIPPEAPRGRAALGCCSTWPQEASRGHSELRLKAYVCFWFLCTTCKESSVLLFLWFDLDWQLRLLLFFFSVVLIYLRSLPTEDVYNCLEDCLLCAALVYLLTFSKCFARFLRRAV